MIVDLVRAGRKVGVTAVSHKVIRNLLDEVVRAAAEEKAAVRCMHRGERQVEVAAPGIDEETEAGKAVAKIRAATYDVVGGTAWVLVEGGPRRGHRRPLRRRGRPDVARERAGVRAGGARTSSCSAIRSSSSSRRRRAILRLGALGARVPARRPPDDAGGARPVPGRDVAASPVASASFTSELFYETKLGRTPGPRPRKRLSDSTCLSPAAGLFYVPVAARREPEQLAGGSRARRRDSCNSLSLRRRPGRHAAKPKPLTLDDILIVAPYNAQVSEIARASSRARIGTVDKFQGQEAPVVIYSMATLEPEDAPHGMEFLYSRQPAERRHVPGAVRLHPRRQPASCSSPNAARREQMRMANAFCRYLELAQPATQPRKLGRSLEIEPVSASGARAVSWRINHCQIGNSRGMSGLHIQSSHVPISELSPALCPPTPARASARSVRSGTKRRALRALIARREAGCTTTAPSWWKLARRLQQRRPPVTWSEAQEDVPQRLRLRPREPCTEESQEAVAAPPLPSSPTTKLTTAPSGRDLEPVQWRKQGTPRTNRSLVETSAVWAHPACRRTQQCCRGDRATCGCGGRNYPR